MPQRIGIPRIEAPRILRPTASPVDTFVSPQQDSSAEQLAQSLSALTPSLARFAGVLGEQKGVREKEAGEAAARDMAAQGKTFAEAVRAGTIRPDQNPWFRVGFYETSGRNAGSEYVGDFLEALGKSSVKDSVELNDFDEFERTFRSQWVNGRLGENPDPFLANAFGATADGQVSGLRNEFARAAGARMGKLNQEAFHSEVFQMVQQFQGTDFSASERAAAIRLAQDRQVATGGMTYDQVNRMTASAIAAASVRLRDTNVLDILDEIPTDMRSRGFLGGTSYGSEIREEAEIAITRAIDGDASRAATLAKRERDAAVRTVSGGMIDALLQDSGADITTYLTEMRKADPSQVPVLIGMRDTIVGGIYADEPEAVRALAIGINTLAPGQDGYTTLGDLNRAFASKHLTLETYRTLRSDLEKRDEAGGSGKFLRNPALTDIAAETWRVFTSEYREDTPAVRANAQAAADEAQYEMLQWLQRNPNAEPEAILTAQTSIRQRVVRRRVGQQDEELGGDQSPAVRKIKPAQFFMTDSLLTGQLDRELQERKEGRRNAFSPVFTRTFEMNGIDPTNIGNVEKFLRDQRAWSTSTTPKP
ncbi:hypothetical protein [Caudoviricetes sp.]|nr:hypothetical protein [Caudoviricetes sp.]